MELFCLPSNVKLTKHAETRMRDQGIDMTGVAYAYAFGKRFYDLESQYGCYLVGTRLLKKDIGQEMSYRLGKGVGIELFYDPTTHHIVTVRRIDTLVVSILC